MQAVASGGALFFLPPFSSLVVKMIDKEQAKCLQIQNVQSRPIALHKEHVLHLQAWQAGVSRCGEKIISFDWYNRTPHIRIFGSVEGFWKGAELVSLGEGDRIQWNRCCQGRTKRTLVMDSSLFCI